MPVEILMPKIGLNMREGLLVEWLVKDGEHVKANQPLYIVETDKVTNEVLAEAGGAVHQVILAGEMVPVAGVVGYILAEGETIAGLAEGSKSASTVNEKEIRAQEGSLLSEEVKQKPNASPAAKRRAKELGIDLSLVVGNNLEGSISLADVERFTTISEEPPGSEEVIATPVARKMAKELGIDLQKLGHEYGGKITREVVENIYLEKSKQRSNLTDIPLKGVRRVIADRMHASSSQTAPVTLFSETDAGNLVGVRSRLNVSGHPEISFNAMFVRLIAIAIKEIPYMNARLEENVIRYVKEINIGVAVDTDRGLLVPVIHNADQKDIVMINSELAQKSEQAQSGTSSIEDLSGGTFTMTNLGSLGVDGFTPIINLPEVAILGIGRFLDKVVVVDGLIGIRKRVVLSLTFDHRLVDGTPAARFLQKLSGLVADCSETLLL